MLIQKIERQVHGQVAAEQRADGGQAAGDAEEERQRAAALTDGEAGDDDRQRGGEENRGRCALQDAERDHPRLGQRAGGRGAAERGADREGGDADHDHPTMTQDVRQTATEREQCRQRQQVAVDDPLRAGRGQRQVLGQAGNRERDDRLVDEHHRHREDHRDENELLVLSRFRHASRLDARGRAVVRSATRHSRRACGYVVLDAAVPSGSSSTPAGSAHSSRSGADVSNGERELAHTGDDRGVGDLRVAEDQRRARGQRPVLGQAHGRDARRPAASTTARSSR